MIPRDKLLHILAGALIAAVAWAASGDAAAGIVAAVVIGAGKELWDAGQPDRTPDVLDAIATAAGGVLLWAVVSLALPMLDNEQRRIAGAEVAERKQPV